MKKLKRNYLSFRQFMSYKVFGYQEPVVPEGYYQHGYHYHEESELPDKDEGVMRDLAISGHQLLGSLAPFYKMAKDVVNTFKPYSRDSQILRDVFAFDIFDNAIKGTTNLVGGVFTLIAWALVSPFALVGCFLPTKYKKDCQQFFTRYLSCPVSWMIEGAGKLLHACTQILATPLVYVIKFPLRAILRGVALYRGKEFLAEEKKSIQDLAEKASQQLNQLIPQPGIGDFQASFPSLKEDFNISEQVCNDLKKKINTEKYSNNEVLTIAKYNINEFYKTIQMPITYENLNKKFNEFQDYLIKEYRVDNTNTDEIKKQTLTLLKSLHRVMIKEMNKEANKRAPKNQQSLIVLLMALQVKYTKSKSKGWKSHLNVNEEKSAFSQCCHALSQPNFSAKDIQSTRNFLKLFSKKKIEEKPNQASSSIFDKMRII